MSKYLVLYTIYNDEDSLIRNNFIKKLEEIGLNKFGDESTSYGSYDGNLEGLTSKLKKLKDELLKKEDKVTLFYADSWSVKSYTINERAI